MCILVTLPTPLKLMFISSRFHLLVLFTLLFLYLPSLPSLSSPSVHQLHSLPTSDRQAVLGRRSSTEAVVLLPGACRQQERQTQEGENLCADTSPCCSADICQLCYCLHIHWAHPLYSLSPTPLSLSLRTSSLWCILCCNKWWSLNFQPSLPDMVGQLYTLWFRPTNTTHP